MQSENVFVHEEKRLKYLLHLPKGLNNSDKKEWPLILFLHGAGERGEDLDLVKIHGVAKVAEQNEDFPFIVVSPQCPDDTYWPMEIETLKALLDKIVQEYPVDSTRIYLTGLSMGGIGGWHLAITNPDTFAAFAPVCGGFSIPVFRSDEFSLQLTSEEMFQKLPLIKDIPVWAFHGDQDDIVPMEETVKIIEILKELGGEAKLTIYEGVGHDSWTATYDNPKLFDWLLEHKRV